MTLNRHVAVPPTPPDPLRGVARTAGILYLITFVSIPTLLLYRPVKDHTDFVLGAGSTTGVMWGALSEIIVAIAGISTAVVLYPVARRQSRAAALGFVTARLVESTLILVGVISLLSIITLRHDVAGTANADTSALTTVGQGFVAVYNRTFLLSQSLMPVACDLLLGYVLYRSGLVHRALPIIAFIGAPLLLASDIAAFFEAFPQVSTVPALAALPVAVFEFSLGVYLIAHGFRPGAVAALGRTSDDPGLRTTPPAPRNGVLPRPVPVVVP